mgnify:CR=1 FL=1
MSIERSLYFLGEGPMHAQTFGLLKEAVDLLTLVKPRHFEKGP